MDSERRHLAIASGFAIVIAIAAAMITITATESQGELEQDAVRALPEMHTLHEGGAVSIREVVLERVAQRHRREVMFRIQIIAAVILGGAALYIILSPKNGFDSATRKWAFGVLNIIAGTFIGTVLAI